MSAIDLPAKEQTKAHIAGLFSTLGKPYDAFRPVWVGADRDARRMFLKITGMPEAWAGKTYDELTPQTRIDMKTRVFALYGWLGKVLKNV